MLPKRTDKSINKVGLKLENFCSQTKKKMEKSKNDSKIVVLNVGGEEYTTAARTLTKYPESLLASSVTAFLKSECTNNHLIPIEKDEHSRLFIDRDGATFRYILDYLRRNKENKEWIQKMIPSSNLFRLRTEAEFYGLKNLVEEVRTESNFVVKKHPKNIVIKKHNQNCTSTRRILPRLLSSLSNMFIKNTKAVEAN